MNPELHPRNVYVASLPASYDGAQLKDLFAPFGVVLSAKVMCDPKSGRCKGYGFVLFEDEEGATRAIQGLVGHVIDGTRIQVRRARQSQTPQAVLPGHAAMPLLWSEAGHSYLHQHQQHMHPHHMHPVHHAVPQMLSAPVVLLPTGTHDVQHQSGLVLPPSYSVPQSIAMMHHPQYAVPMALPHHMYPDASAGPTVIFLSQPPYGP